MIMRITKKTGFLLTGLLLVAMISAGCQDDNPAAPTVNQDKAEFTYEEIAAIFDYTGKTLEEAFGASQQILADEGTSIQSKQYIYPEMSFNLGFFTDFPDGSVYEANLTNDHIAAPRDLKIGDSLDQVISVFPQTANDIITEGALTYKMLYGQFEYMTNFGYIEYQNDTAVKILYVNEGVGLEFLLKNDQVCGYHYFMSTN